MERSFIALGSNLGDRAFFMREARRRVAELDGVRLLGASSIHETQPVGPAGQEPYLNAVIEVDTSLDARDLLEHLLAIESDLGRRRTVRWGPRQIDLDILLFGDVVIDEPGLTVPHPRLAERAFVLAPLAELKGELIPPGLGKSVDQLLNAAERSGVNRISIDRWSICSS